MRKLLLRSLLVFPLVTSLALGPCASQLAYADTRHVFSLELPLDGALDRYHDARALGEPRSASLYALRSTTVEDLLRTRIALKTLIGGNARLQRVMQRTALTLAVPGLVHELYSIDPTMLALATSVDQDKAEFDINLRARLVMGLAHVSALIVRYEQALKYFQRDYWADRRIDAEFYDQFVRAADQRSMMMGKSDHVGQLTAEARAKWMKSHGMEDTLAVLEGQRESLLDRYRLLAVPVKGQPLYRHIYRALVKEGFPSPEMVQSAEPSELPGGTQPIAFATEFDSQMNEALEHLTGDTSAQQLSRVSIAVNPRIDEALASSIEANTDTLKSLTEERDWNGKLSSPLAELARFDELWSATEAKFGYLKPRLDFESARRYFTEEFRRSDSRKKNVRRALYGVGIGLGVAAMIASGGGEAAILGVGSKALFLGSGALTSAGTVLDYVNSRAAARVARGMFLGSAHVASPTDMQDASLMESGAFRNMVLTIGMLGCDLPIVTALSKGRTIVVKGARSFVRVTTPEREALERAIARVAARAERLAPMGRALLATANRLVKLSAGSEQVMDLEQAIRVAARSLKIAPSAARAKLEANPVLGKLVAQYKDRIVADPNFLKVMINEQVASASVGIVTEMQARGDATFKDELGYTAFDLASGALSTAAIVTIIWPRASVIAREAKLGVKTPATIFESGFSNKERLAQFWKTGKNNMIVGFSVSAGTSALMDGIDMARTRYSDDVPAPTLGDRAKNALASAAYSGTFMAVSSNMRYQFTSYLSGNIGRILKNDATAKMVLTRVSLANNFVGGWHYIKIARAVGVQKEAEALRFKGEDLGSALVQLNAQSEAGESGSGYLLDFMNQ